MTPADIATNFRAVRARVDAAARNAHREPASVRLVAVSKTKPAWMVRAARDAGALVFGENYVQEATAKQQEIADDGPGGPPFEWHLIGALQTNKAKQVVGKFALVHAVDSEKLARELEKRAVAQDVARVDVLLEVNVAGEASKAGVAPEEAAATLRALAATAPLTRVRFRGLMTMPPPEDAETNRPHFRRVAALAAELRASGLLAADATELSMGTTSDFESAIAEGATLVRVGTAIFGEREYAK